MIHAHHWIMQTSGWVWQMTSLSAMIYSTNALEGRWVGSLVGAWSQTRLQRFLRWASSIRIRRPVWLDNWWLNGYMGHTKWKTFCFCGAVTPPSIARICETHFLHCMWHRFQSFDLCLPCRLCGNTLFTGWKHELNSLRGQKTEGRVLAKQILLALKLLCEWNLSQSDNVKYEKDTKQSPNSHEPGWELGREFAAKSQKRFATKSYIMIILWVCLIFFASWIYNNIHKCGNFVEPVAEAKQQLQRLQLFSTLCCIFASDSTAAQHPISSPCWESPVYSTLFRDVQSCCPLIPNMILLSSIVYFPYCSHGSVFFVKGEIDDQMIIIWSFNVAY